MIGESELARVIAQRLLAFNFHVIVNSNMVYTQVVADRLPSVVINSQPSLDLNPLLEECLRTCDVIILAVFPHLVLNSSWIHLKRMSCCFFILRTFLSSFLRVNSSLIWHWRIIPFHQEFIVLVINRDLIRRWQRSTKLGILMLRSFLFLLPFCPMLSIPLPYSWEVNVFLMIM